MSDTGRQTRIDIHPGSIEMHQGSRQIHQGSSVLLVIFYRLGGIMAASIQLVVPEGCPMNLLSRLGSNLKIGTRVGAGFVLTLALLCAVAGLGYLALSKAEQSTT